MPGGGGDGVVCAVLPAGVTVYGFMVAIGRGGDGAGSCECKCQWQCECECEM